MTKFFYVIRVRLAAGQSNSQNGICGLILGRKSNFIMLYYPYYTGLTGPAKARYWEKVLICGFDTYMLKKSERSEDLVDFPSVKYPDIGNYLMLQTSWITGQQMKTLKAMEA